MSESKLSPEKLTAVLALFDEGVSCNRIGLRVGIDQKTVRRWVREHGRDPSRSGRVFLAGGIEQKPEERVAASVARDLAAAGPQPSKLSRSLLAEASRRVHAGETQAAAIPIPARLWVELVIGEILDGDADGMVEALESALGAEDARRIVDEVIARFEEVREIFKGAAEWMAEEAGSS